MPVDALDAFELERSLARLVPGSLRRGTYAQPPFCGYLESPGARAGAGELELRGWLFARRPIARLTVSLDGGDETELELGRPRPDLTARFAGQPHAARSGFAGVVVAGRGRRRLEVWAQLGGSRRLAFQKVVELGGSLPATPSLEAPFAALLARCAGDEFPELPRAVRVLHRALGDDEVARLLRPPPRAMIYSHAPRLPGRRRILFVCGMFPSESHGGGLRLHDLIGALAARHEVDLLSVFRPALDEASWNTLARSLGAVRLVRAEPRPDDALAWLDRLERRAGHYDAVYFEFPDSAPLIAPLARFARRSCFTMMECLTRARLLALSRALVERPAALEAAALGFAHAYALEAAALAGSDVAIAVSSADAAFARRAFAPRRLEVVPTCVSEALFRPLDEPPRAPSAVFVAYYDHAPNLDALDWYLSHIHPLIIQSIPEYRFFVVGRGSFSALRARFPSDPSVEWVGAVDDVAEAIARARIGVAPLVSGAGIRGKINQYLAAGRPVVTTGIGISGMDAHRHGQSLLVADDAERFAAAVVRLLREDDLWSRLRGAGRAVVDRHYRWGPALARLEALHGA